MRNEASGPIAILILAFLFYFFVLRKPASSQISQQEAPTGNYYGGNPATCFDCEYLRKRSYERRDELVPPTISFSYICAARHFDLEGWDTDDSVWSYTFSRAYRCPDFQQIPAQEIAQNATDEYQGNAY